MRPEAIVSISVALLKDRVGVWPIIMIKKGYFLILSKVLIKIKYQALIINNEEGAKA